MIDRDRFRSGDHRYFEQLVRQYGPLVLTVTRAFGRDPDHADDLFQEVWKNVYTSRDSYDGRGSFEGWLHRVAKNACVSDYRSRKVRWEARDQMEREGRGEELSWRPLDPLSDAERKEIHRRLHRALAFLSEREYQAVILRIFEGRSPDDVADIMGVSKATVRSNIRHAVSRLREMMEDPGDDLSRYQSAH